MSAPWRITVFVGTRPEVIKLAPVIKEIRTRQDLVLSVVATSQHREMLEQSLKALKVEIDSDLDVMRPGQTLSMLTSRLIEGVDGYLDGRTPDMAIVQGDTTTVLTAALVCFYRRIPIAHVEAGLRTNTPSSPFPEEANRRMVAPLATMHFANTAGARENLLRERISPEHVWVTGSTAIDSLLAEVDRQQGADTGRHIRERTTEQLGFDIEAEPYVLITGHRRESFGDGFDGITTAIARLAKRFPDHHFAYPVHLNPRVQEPVYGRLSSFANVHLTAPLDYSSFVAAMCHCKLVLTDSGGLQEEAPALGKPVLVMRESTERPEGVRSGNARLVGTDAENIFRTTASLLTDVDEYERMASAVHPYGDGHASKRIVDAILENLRERNGDDITVPPGSGD